MPLRALILSAALSLSGTALAAGPMYWDWPADRPFSELDLSGAALDAGEHLVAGLTARQLTPEGPEVFWLAVADGQGGFYTGSGHGGEVHHAAANGKDRLLARLEATEVFSLLRLPGGDLLAGCGPEGSLYRIKADGTSRLEGVVPGGYIWDMAQGVGSGTVWLAVGSPAALYSYDPAAGELSAVTELPAQNALDVFATADGGVLVATQGPGLIYRQVGRKPIELLYETPQDEVRQFVAGPEGAVFALALAGDDDQIDALNGRSAGPQPAPPAALLPLLGFEPESDVPTSALYRVGDDGLVETWWSGDEELMTAAWSARWGWLAGGPLDEETGKASLLNLTPPSGTHELCRWEGGDVLDILVPAAADQDLVVCQAHPGAVFALTERGDEPRVALSPPLDGGRPAQWGRLTWTGTGKGASPKWAVRGGNRAEPDESWTDWTGDWSDNDHAIDLPACRFLQWRVEFPRGALAVDAWRITEVAVSAWQDNQPPVIAEFQLEHLKDIHLGGMLNGGENVTQRFRSGLQAEFSRGAASDSWAGPDRGAMGRSVRVFTWRGSDPNGDRIVYRLEYRREGEAAWRPISGSRPGVRESAETISSWDTSEVPDGSYEVRLTASDHRDNPADLARESSRRLGPITVDNSPPTVSDFQVQSTATGFAVKCRAEDVASALAGARITLPDGTVERLDPVDRICDSRRENFSAEIAWPRAGEPAGSRPWLVRVEVRDLSGNLGTAEGEVR